MKKNPTKYEHCFAFMAHEIALIKYPKFIAQKELVRRNVLENKFSFNVGKTLARLFLKRTNLYAVSYLSMI